MIMDLVIGVGLGFALLGVMVWILVSVNKKK
jgi:hypothetical protein